MGYDVSIDSLATGIGKAQILIDDFEVLNEKLAAVKGIRAASTCGDRPDEAAPGFNAPYEKATQTLVNYWQQALDHLREFQADLQDALDTYEDSDAHGVRHFRSVGE